MCIFCILSENRSGDYCCKTGLANKIRKTAENLKQATQAVLAESRVDGADIKAIGISYQMHGLVCVDKDSASIASGYHLV